MSITRRELASGELRFIVKVEMPGGRKKEARMTTWIAARKQEKKWVEEKHRLQEERRRKVTPIDPAKIPAGWGW